MSKFRNPTNQPLERDAEHTHAKAAKAEFAKDYDQAFRLYVKAAEAFLHLGRSGIATDKKKLQWRNSAAKALERAETIKKFVDASRGAAVGLVGTPSQSAVPNICLTPIAIDIFSQQEQSYVVMKGTYVNGRRFPLWDEPSGPIAVRREWEVYSDPEGQPQLSAEQQKESPVWRRPLSLHTSSHTPRSQRHILPQEILQHIVTDCSVCASISVCLEHAQRFGSFLAESAVHDTSDSPDQMGAKGRYDVRVYFNGGWRRIGEFDSFVVGLLLSNSAVIDDQLPFHPIDGRLMCMTVQVSSTSSADGQTTRDTIWPSLLEKAYMKLMGGYDFLGSNSGIDLHALIGWIPEHIDMRRSQFERERTWEKMKQGFLKGQCLVTLGTGVGLDIRWRNVCLLSSHSYAVTDLTADPDVDVHETSDDRILTVLDSWVRSEEDKQLSSVLRIPWSEVLNTFDGLYLSWDPSIYSTQLTFHGMWKLIEGDDDSRTTHLQAEFQYNPSEEDEVLILLTRHVLDTRKISDYVALHVQIEDHLILDADSHNQTLSSRGAYTNSTQVLNRVRIPHLQQSGVLLISASYEGDGTDVGYTVTMYSQKNVKLSWIENQKSPFYKEKVTGSFTSKTAGGNCTYPSFMINPQYRLSLPSSNFKSEKAKVSLTLQVGKDLPVNVAMVWSQGQRISEFSEKELAATSGAYSYGLARVTKAMSPGEYTIAVSAFEPQHMGPFTLKVESSHPFDMQTIPQEGAGMYSRVVQGSWDGQSAGGAPSFGRYTKNPVFKLEAPSSTQLKIRLQLLQSSPAVALNVTVFANVGGDTESSLRQKTPVLTSGAYDDTVAGVATPQITLAAGKYYVVPSTYSPGHEAGYKLIIYSTASGVTITPV